MSDPLLRATSALKEKYADEPPAPAATRERILDRTSEKASRRRVSRWMLMPIAAAFLLIAGWATATGAVQRLFESAPPPTPPTPTTTSSASDLSRSGSAPTPTSTPTPTATATISGQGSAPTPQSSPPSASLPEVRTSTSTPASGPDDALYAAAHRAHFEDRDFAAALAGWDRYLAASPNGRFAPEAKYNRALCLLRLGRKQEANDALAPFADGTMGGYRQAEAQRLRDALASEPAP
jgi:TolA-binding protein